jgi:Insertion element 4 transposase N-terminal/Transposase DDE domain
MLRLGKEVGQLAEKLTAERVRSLKRIIPCATIKTILKQCGLTRVCSRVPNWFMIWFVIGLGLFCQDCYRQIFRWLQKFRPGLTPGRSTLCEARKRLGVAPLRLLYEAVVRLLGTPAISGAFYQGLRVMSLDGFVVDVSDTEANSRMFGRPGGGRSPGAFPQVRVLALCEAATHVLWRVLIKPRRRCEQSMTQYLLRFLTPAMLLLWDRNFLSFRNLATVCERGAHLLARIRKHLVLQPQQRFPDGSFLAKLYPSPNHRRADRGGRVVRVLEYTFDDPQRPGSGEKHRLLTTLLDWRQHPAKTLILLYHQRWEQENAIDELKTHQRQRPVLRSQTPQGVVQEIYGLLLAHYLVRRLMFDAAQARELAPLQLSFVNTLKILRCRLPECPKSRRGLRKWYEDLLAEIGQEVLEPRRDRVNPRVIKQKISKWPKKRQQHYDYPQPRKKIQRSIVMIR